LTDFLARTPSQNAIQAPTSTFPLIHANLAQTIPLQMLLIPDAERPRFVNLGAMPITRPCNAPNARHTKPLQVIRPFVLTLPAIIPAKLAKSTIIIALLAKEDIGTIKPSNAINALNNAQIAQATLFAQDVFQDIILAQ